MTRKFFLAVACSLVAASSFAYNPPARYETRMVYDSQTSHMILFGGATGVDSATAQLYRLNDTWEWTGSRWFQRFPAHSPEGRSGHIMVYDGTRVVMWGGRGQGGTDLNDTWVYANRDWTQINTPNSPPGRILGGGAWDPVRNRLVIYGGTSTSADLKTITPLHDTWEFDGTNWTQIGGEGPAVTKPLLAYDVPRNQMIMLALDANLATVMYTYDPAAGTWNQVKPATVPGCVNEGQLTYADATQTIVYTGGVCATTEGQGADTTYEWDGTTWNKATLINGDNRVFGAAMAYDSLRQQTTLFGGTPIIGSPLQETWVYSSAISNGILGASWFSLADGSYPAPRSLYAFATDPVNNAVWLYGGTDQFTSYSDLWEYQNGAWTQIFVDNTPASCLTPTAAYDTDRSKLVLVCATSEVFEFDGATWTSFSGLKKIPPLHSWASLVYDPGLKKTVLFGGYDGTNSSYLNQTWTWDGKVWTQVKNHPPTSRSNTMMWYDPTLKKTVIYGGVGRVTTGDRVTRYSDMWSFDGSGWTQLKPAATPGQRYGAQTVVDPHTGHVLLFGGLIDNPVPATPPSTTPGEKQTYVNDTWEWDGTTWKLLSPSTSPSPRENGRMAYDPSRDNLVLFGGYGGSFLADTWTYNNSNWGVMIFDPLGGRRRVTGGN